MFSNTLVILPKKKTQYDDVVVSAFATFYYYCFVICVLNVVIAAVLKVPWYDVVVNHFCHAVVIPIVVSI